jgi:hypothetical protein
MKSSILALSFVALTISALQGQTTGPAVKVDIKAPKFEATQTPQFQAGNVPDKNWRPKNWLQIDMEFDIKLPSAAGGRNGSLASMTVNYYLAMNATTKDGKRQVMKGSFDYVDIPAAEKCHALAFVSPATLRRLLEKDAFVPSDISGWGVEVIVEGQRVAGDGSIKGPWWEKTDTLAINDNTMLPKKDTPFAILWGDYDVGVKNK